MYQNQLFTKTKIIMELKDLTPEQKQKLFAEMKEKEALKEKSKKEERKIFKDLSSKEVEEMLKPLQQLSSEMSAAKTKVFEAFKSLIEMKVELYNVKADQQSHTFSNKDNTKRIRLGYRVFDRYDDTAEMGIQKVREYIDTLAKDEETSVLVNMINKLLKRDIKGNLKANRVVDLVKLASDSDSELFKDGVQIIVDAHKPERSADFIEAEWKNDGGKWNSVPLSISSVPFLTKE